jgi:preprotein translocase subunit SecG
MTLNPLLAAGLVMNVLAALFLISSIVLILIILIQKGKGGGLSSAFAGGMTSGLLGSKTGDVLTWITIGVVSFFLLGALVLDKWWKPTLSPGAPGQTPAPVTSTENPQSPAKPSPSESGPTNQAPLPGEK